MTDRHVNAEELGGELAGEAPTSCRGPGKGFVSPQTVAALSRALSSPPGAEELEQLGEQLAGEVLAAGGGIAEVLELLSDAACSACSAAIAGELEQDQELEQLEELAQLGATLEELLADASRSGEGLAEIGELLEQLDARILDPAGVSSSDSAAGPGIAESRVITLPQDSAPGPAFSAAARKIWRSSARGGSIGPLCTYQPPTLTPIADASGLEAGEVLFASCVSEAQTKKSERPEFPRAFLTTTVGTAAAASSRSVSTHRGPLSRKDSGNGIIR